MGNFGKYTYICRQMYNLKQRNKIKYHNILCPTARLITLPTIDGRDGYDVNSMRVFKIVQTKCEVELIGRRQ
jgi:SET domain-containing protein